MKTQIRYEVREYVGNSCSRRMSMKLRDRKTGQKLVKRLKKMGHQAFLAKIKISIH